MGYNVLWYFLRAGGNRWELGVFVFPTIPYQPQGAWATNADETIGHSKVSKYVK